MNKKRESGFGRQLISQMFTAMFFTAVAFGVLAVVAWWAGNSRTWQGWEPNYALFSWAKDNFLLVAACGLLGVWFLVGWWFLRRALKSTETLLQAAKQLADPGEEPIRLPAALKSTGTVTESPMPMKAYPARQRTGQGERSAVSIPPSAQPEHTRISRESPKCSRSLSPKKRMITMEMENAA